MFLLEFTCRVRKIFIIRCCQYQYLLIETDTARCSRMIKACLINVSQSAPKIIGTSGTKRACSWSFVPFLRKRVFSPCRIRGLASRIRTNGIFCACHDTNTLLCANWCPRPSSVGPIYIKGDEICSCSVGSFGSPNKGIAVQHFFLCEDMLFFGLHLIYLIYIANQYQFMCQIFSPSGLFQCSMRSKTRP